MQGRSVPQRELLDAESVSGHLLPAGSVFAFLAVHRMRLFPAAEGPVMNTKVTSHLGDRRSLTRFCGHLGVTPVSRTRG